MLTETEREGECIDNNVTIMCAICVSLFVQSLTYLGHSIDIRVKTVAWQYFDVCSHVNPDAFFRLRGKVLLHFDLY
jgi:hypothetical protein